MRRLISAFTSPSASMQAALLGAAIAIAALLSGSEGARALPVNGSNCGSNWVNNQGALACFIKGEEDTNSGTSPPHYVGCSADGEIFCCVDTKDRGQICESVGTAEHADVQQQVRAILEGQAAILANMARMSKRLDALENKLSGQDGKNQQ